MQKRALVLGAGGFIGSHMVKRLKQEGYWVRGIKNTYDWIVEQINQHKQHQDRSRVAHNI